MDLRGSIPCFIRITAANVHDVNILDELLLQPGAFYGTSPNAVKTQIWIAISVYLLVAILKKELKIERSLGEILQILSITLFEKVPMNQVLRRFPLQQEEARSCKQLILFEF